MKSLAKISLLINVCSVGYEERGSLVREEVRVLEGVQDAKNTKISHFSKEEKPMGKLPGEPRDEGGKKHALQPCDRPYRET